MLYYRLDIFAFITYEINLIQTTAVYLIAVR